MKVKAALLSVAIIGLAGCDQATAVDVEDQSVRPARILRVQSSAGDSRHTFVGRVEAAQTVDMTFQVSGPLAELPIKEGQTVAKGALVAALDPSDFMRALRESDVELKLAAQDLERKQSLLQRRVISQSLVDEAQARFQLWQVRAENAAEHYADSRIVAPFDAYVTRRYTDNFVNVQAGQNIARLSDLNELFVVASVPGSLLATVGGDDVAGVEATFSFIPDERFPLEYRENIGEAESVAQTYEVTFAMRRPQAWNILPGMSATVTVSLKAPTGSPGIRIPASALVTKPDKSFHVWVYDDDSSLVSERAVEVGAVDTAGVQILRGLAAGDLIVAAGANQLQPGMKVRVLGELEQ